MRTHLLSLLLSFPVAAAAQTVATFETPALPKQDTFFMRYDMPKKDVGFNSGMAHFPLYTDSFGTSAFWTSGFTYSSMRDSVSGGQGNQYSARPGKAAAGTQYAVAYGERNKVMLTGSATGHSVAGFYLTNNSYTWNSMKYGDSFARKFGDTTGTNSGLPQGSYPDFFRVIIQGYNGGVLKPDTVEVYLADYRAADPANDYLVSDWRWVNLLKLGGVDSLQFTLQSSDAATFGGTTYINTPLYFCMDDFTTNENVGVSTAMATIIAKVYPNPAQDVLQVELAERSSAASLVLFDAGGKPVLSQTISGSNEQLDIRLLPAGNYFLQISSVNGQTATQRIIKQ